MNLGDGEDWETRVDFGDLQLPFRCFMHKSLEEWFGVQYADFVGNCWRCPRCGKEERSAELLRLESAMARSARQLFSWDLTAHRPMKGRKDVRCLPDHFVHRALVLFDAACNVLGRNHWIYQMGALFFVDLHLSVVKVFSYQPRPPMVPLALLVDLWRWLAGIQLSQEPACWLHGRIVEALRVRGLARDHGIGRTVEVLRVLGLVRDHEAELVSCRQLMKDHEAELVSCRQAFKDHEAQLVSRLRKLMKAALPCASLLKDRVFVPKTEAESKRSVDERSGT